MHKISCLGWSFPPLKIGHLSRLELLSLASRFLELLICEAVDREQEQKAPSAGRESKRTKRRLVSRDSILCSPSAYREIQCLAPNPGRNSQPMKTLGGRRSPGLQKRLESLENPGFEPCLERSTAEGNSLGHVYYSLFLEGRPGWGGEFSTPSPTGLFQPCRLSPPISPPQPGCRGRSSSRALGGGPWWWSGGQVIHLTVVPIHIP